MKIRTIADLTKGLVDLLGPLGRTVTFADLVITASMFKHRTSSLWILVKTYRTIEDNINKTLEELQDFSTTSAFTRYVGSLEVLLQDNALNFYKPANSFHQAIVEYNALKSSSKRHRALNRPMKSISEFQESASAAVHTIQKIQRIVAKYGKEMYRGSCTPVSNGSSVGVDEDAETDVAHYDMRFSRHSGKRGRTSADERKRFTDTRNGAQRSGKAVTFARKEEIIGKPPSNKESTVSIRTSSNMRHSHSSTKQPPRKRASQSSRGEYTVFISHCGRDKYSMAIPLHEKLTNAGISSFVDKESLTVGENAHDAMNRAMATAPICVFISSGQAAARKWPMKELRCFQKRYDAAQREGKHGPFIIPVFYRMTVDECSGEGLFDLESSTTNGTVFRKEGFFNRVESGETSMKEVRKALKKLTAFTGIENDEGATNANTITAQNKREQLQNRIVTAVEEAVGRL